MAVSNSQHPWHLSQVNVFSGFPVCSDQYICFPALEMRKLGLRVSIRKTFAQFFWNETKNFSLRISFARKNNNLCNHSQKSFRAKLPYSAFAKLKFCAIPQFRKNQTVGDSVFLRIQFWKNLVLKCLPIGHFYIIDQWQLRRVQISQFSRQF